MILGACSLKELLKWFEEQQTEYEFLVVFASSGRADSKLIQDLVQQHESVNLRTLRRVLVFFHHPDAEEYVEFNDSPHRLFLPASETEVSPIPQRGVGIRTGGISFRMIRSVRIDEVSDLDSSKVREIAKNASKFTEQLLQHFGLDYGDLPGFFCFKRGFHEPFYASTFGVQDIDPALEFFTQLFKIDASIPLDFDPSKRAVEAKRVSTKRLKQLGVTQIGLTALEDEHSRLVARLERAFNETNVSRDLAARILDDLSLTTLVRASAYHVVMHELENGGYPDVAQTLLNRVDIDQVLSQLDRVRGKYRFAKDENLAGRATDEGLSAVKSLDESLAHHLNLLEQAKTALQAMEASYQQRTVVSGVSKYLNNLLEMIRKLNSARKELREFMSEAE